MAIQWKFIAKKCAELCGEKVKKNILILGAGLMQKPAILSAKELGFRCCVIDADENAVCVPLADEFQKIDLKNKEQITEYAKKLQSSENSLVAVFTAGTDFSASVSYVCEQCGLQKNAHSYRSALNASIKTKMRECFAQQEIPSPSFMNVQKDECNAQLLPKVLQKMSFPFVVKPVDNMGARGCRMIRNETEFLSSVTTAVNYSRTQNAIIEQYMEGPEFSIDALVYDGTFTVTGFAVRHIEFSPYFIEIGHTMPCQLDEKMHNQLISVFALGAKALGLTCGAAKADIKFTKNGPMIGEIAARLSGGYMSGWTFPYASDLNLTKQGILISAGMNPQELLEKRVPVDYEPSILCQNKEKPYELFEIPCVRTSAERAWYSIPGEVEYIENINEYSDKAVFDILPRAQVHLGSKVDFPRNNVEKCGNVIAVSHNSQIAVQAAEDAVSNVFITIKPNTQETDDFLSGKTKDDEKDFPPSAFPEIPKNLLENLSGTIKENQKISECIPVVLQEQHYQGMKDWSFNTLEQIAQKFDILRQKHPALDTKKFWQAVLRGGLQAAVYFSDSAK